MAIEKKKSKFNRRPVDNNKGSANFTHNAEKDPARKTKASKKVVKQSKKHVSKGGGQ